MTRQSTHRLAVLLFSLTAISAVSALEIPLKQSFDEGGGGTTIAYVDMETIFQEFPETAKAKDQYYKELADKREVLSQQEKELTDLREQLAVLKSTLEAAQAGAAGTVGGATTTATTAASTTTASVDQSTAVTVSGLTVSTASLAAVSQGLAQREELLKQKETSFVQNRLTTATELKKMEQQRTAQIYGKLYRALVQLADEQGISLVVDKSSILYGQPAMDLTDRLSRRVRGLPDEDTELQAQ